MNNLYAACVGCNRSKGSGTIASACAQNGCARALLSKDKKNKNAWAGGAVGALVFLFVPPPLTAEEIGSSSFVALVNSAMIFRVDSDQVELAAKALKLANYRLANLENKSQLLGILNGLATVAAAARSAALADELRILVRRYGRDARYGFSIEEAVRICLVASASREDLMDWREFAGDWLTELAFNGR